MDTTDKVGELEALLANATPGPWVAYDDTDTPNRRCEVLAMGKTICHIYHSVAAEDPSNANLIAAAVNALPELLRVYRAWQGAEVSTVQENRGYMKDCSYYAPAPKTLDKQRVRLVPDGQGE